MAVALRRAVASVCGLGPWGPRPWCVFERGAETAAGRRAAPPAGRFVLLFALVATVASLSSCANKQASATPPAPEPVARTPRPAPPPSGPVSEPQTVASLPSPQPVPPEAVPETQGPLVNQPEERASSEPVQARPLPAPGAPPATSESSPPPETPAASVPQLGQIMSASQRRHYNLLIDQAIARAQDRLKVVVAQSARLNEEQHTAIKRIQAFIQQAKEKREQDLTIAWNLADRAKLLAEDLAKNFK